MKINMFLRGLFTGTVLTAIVSGFALYQNNREWERQAFIHLAGVYTANYRTGEQRWMWFDDYARTVLLPKAKEDVHSTPTPLPKEWQKL